MITFSTFALWLHLAAMAIWVGGLVTVPLVAVPVLKASGHSPTESIRLVAGTIRRFHRLSLEMNLLLVITGLFNLMHAGMARQFEFPAPYLHLLLTKVGLFLVIAGIQGWQALRLAPAMASIDAPDAAAECGRLYRRFLGTSVLNAALALIVVLLGLRLRYG